MLKVVSFDKPDGETLYRLVWSRENGEIILAETSYDDDISLYRLMDELNSFEDMLLERERVITNVEQFTRRVFTITRLMTTIDVVVTVYDQEDDVSWECLVASNIPLGWGERVMQLVQFIGKSYLMFDELLTPEEA